MKSSKKTQERAENSNINYRAVFAGETLVTPIMFNPNAEQIKTIKNLPEDFDVNEPEYARTITINGEEKTFSVISLYTKFNPNEALGVEKQYSDSVVIPFELLLSPNPVKGKNSGKYQIIDESNVTAWVRVPDKRKKLSETIKEQIDTNEYSQYDSIHKINPETARIACVGEVALYQLIFDLSTLDPHRPDKDMELTEFKLGENPTETFKNICNGDVTVLNDLMQYTGSTNELMELFVTNGNQNQLGVFLGGRPNSDHTRLYQTVMTAATQVNITYRSTFRPFDPKMEKNGMENLGETQMPKEALKVLVDENYPWQSEWGGTLALKEIKLSDVKENETEIEEDSDLPF